MSTPRFVFFGTPDIAVTALDHLEQHGMTPTLVVTAPDKPQGRGLVLTPPEARVWADARSIPVIQPSSLKTDPSVAERVVAEHPDALVVVAYGKIIPQNILDIAPRGAINLHPSLLPRHRGPCPIESQVLTEPSWEGVGVSIMLLDALMDHGPVLAQRGRLPELEGRWPIRTSELRPLLARYGAELLATTLADLDTALAHAHEQEHAQATTCNKIEKADAELDLAADAETNYRKFLAYDVWPRAFFFVERNGTRTRVIITDAVLENDRFVIKRVIPEGRNEMSYETFMR